MPNGRHADQVSSKVIDAERNASRGTPRSGSRTPYESVDLEADGRALIRVPHCPALRSRWLIVRPEWRRSRWP
jgi:hypothetical protein